VVYRFGDVVLDTEACQLSRGGSPVHVSPKALALLTLLVESRPRVLTKAELHDRIWPDTCVVDANLPVVVREIRVAIGDDRHEIIRTVHRRGYAFAGGAFEVSPGPAGQVEATGHCLLIDDRVLVLAPGENRVGRDPAVEVSLPWTSVSRNHAVIRVDGTVATLVDLRSKNGTWVAGQPVVEPVRLADGVEIRFGRITVVYRSGEWSGETASLGDSLRRSG
jgi:DNA-binding winged helix-turn-helix (wHTH) protein